MKYKLTDMASIAEVVAAVAIVVSLIFVGVQLKHNAQATMSASAIAASQVTSEWYTQIGSSDKNSALFRQFIADPDPLSPDQQYQAIILLHSIMLILQNNFYLSNEGTLDPGIKNSIFSSMVAVKDKPGWKLYWKLRRSLFLKEFQQYIDDLMATEINHEAEGLYEVK